MKKKIINKIIINPGSVGQPRDGEKYAKWCILDTQNSKFEFKKTKFNYNKIIKQINFYDNSKKKLIKYFQK